MMHAQDAIDRLRENIRESSSDTNKKWTDAVLLRAWNTEQRRMALWLACLDQGYMLWEQTITWVADQSSYALEPHAARIKVIQDGDYGEVPFDDVAWSSGLVFQEYGEVTVGESSDVVRLTERVHIENSNLVWRPTPSASGATRTVKYYSKGADLHKATASAGGTATITFPATATTGQVFTEDDYYNHMQLYIISGTGSGQTATIIDYVGSTRVATVSSNWATQPDATSVYALISPLPEQFHEVALAGATRLAFLAEREYSEAKAWTAIYEERIAEARLFGGKRHVYMPQPLDLTSWEMEEAW